MGVIRDHSSTVVRWNGGSWDTLAAWQNSPADYSTCLTIDNSGNLYVGGRFDTIGGIGAKNVARWDGRVWGALGSGTNMSDYSSSSSGGRVAALTMDGSGNLYAGGEFTVAGGKVSAYVAQCRLKNTGILPHGGDKASPAFMTYNPRCRTIRFYLKAHEKIFCRIFSLSGREVIGSSGFLPVGDHALKINDVRLAPGAYIVQARTGKESMRFKMTVER
jgi:hypothetical protein